MTCALLCLSLLLQLAAASSEEAPVPLPEPDIKGTVPLEEALSRRRSVRSFSSKELGREQVSQLLWACQGVTGSGGRRTAPSAGGLYALETLLADKSGLYRYVPESHSLEKLAGEDFRARLSAAALGQGSVGKAPASIILAGSPARLQRKYRGRSERYALMEAGHAAQNVLLQAAALGLGAVPVGAFDDAGLAGLLPLSEGFRPYYIIPVGHP